MPIIDVKSLTREFVTKQKEAGLKGSLRTLFKPTYNNVRAVDGISFEVKEGELLAFIGPNGAGKSTTIKMLTGILYPTSGEATVMGLTPWKARGKLSFYIGSVFGQKSQLWYHLPPKDSFNLLAKIYEIPQSDYRGRIGQLIGLFEIEEVMKTPVRKLSLGQRMRCEIAAALIHRPRMIFLDEPTIGLDVVAKLRIRDLIKQLNREEGVTIFLTSHDAGDVEELCKRVIVINHGIVVLDTSVSHLKRNYLKSKVIDLKLESQIDGFQMDGVRVVKKSGYGMKLEVDTEAVPIEEVISQIMRFSKVADITISDPPMEEIITQIYNRGKEAVANDSDRQKTRSRA
jgi:ABC-2 type transport system ATP-binding protein